MAVVAVDKFSKYYTNLDSPGKHSFTVTPSDTDDLAVVTRAVWVGTAGHLKVTMAGDADDSFVTLSNIPSGSWLWLRVKRIWTVAGTATNVVGIY